jgi:phosphoribosylaminoimidazole-succinocarboxamide synthase
MVSAWDGARMEKVPWKGALSTTINSNIFKYLNSVWINTSYKRKVSENETLVEELNMIPVECVFRFVETWSYTKRKEYELWDNANLDWTILDKKIIELFYKEDIIDTQWNIISDPLIKFNKSWEIEIDQYEKIVFLHPKTWKEIKYNIAKNSNLRWNSKIIIQKYNELINKTSSISNHIKNFYLKSWISTLDWKIEFWKDKDWKIKLWDVIDWDSCRNRIIYTVEWTDWEIYLTREFSKNELILTWKDLKIFEWLSVIPDNIDIERVHVATSLDKQSFRDGWNWNELVKKYEELARLTKWAYEMHQCEIEYNIDNTSDKVIDILWRNKETENKK